MREIKFRGKDILHKSWKHGSLAKDEPQKSYYIIDNQYGSGTDVDENTIGQYTGLKDKNGKEIYEGDIVAIQFDLTSTKSKVEWLQEISGFIVKDVSILDDELAKRIVVIGNIYDNPELLEKEGSKDE